MIKLAVKTLSNKIWRESIVAPQVCKITLETKELVHSLQISDVKKTLANENRLQSRGSTSKIIKFILRFLAKILYIFDIYQ